MSQQVIERKVRVIDVIIGFAGTFKQKKSEKRNIKHCPKRNSQAMVNKQYNVHSLNKKQLNQQYQSATPSIKPNFTVISSVPNDKHTHLISAYANNSNNQTALTDQSAFERNISQQYHHRGGKAANGDNFDFVDGNFDNNNSISLSITSDITTTVDDTDQRSNRDHISTAAGRNDSPNKQPISIHDIGRFQYILQMDREMVS